MCVCVFVRLSVCVCVCVCVQCCRLRALVSASAVVSQCFLFVRDRSYHQLGLAGRCNDTIAYPIERGEYICEIPQLNSPVCFGLHLNSTSLCGASWRPFGPGVFGILCNPFRNSINKNKYTDLWHWLCNGNERVWRYDPGKVEESRVAVADTNVQLCFSRTTKTFYPHLCVSPSLYIYTHKPI